MLEKNLEKWLGTALRRMGCLYLKFVSPGSPGVPDRLVILPGGKVIFLELKADGGQLSRIQRRQIELMRKQGSDVRVLRGMVDAGAFVMEMAVKGCGAG